jgi:hypothetical protein
LVLLKPFAHRNSFSEVFGRSMMRLWILILNFNLSQTKKPCGEGAYQPVLLCISILVMK